MTLLSITGLLVAGVVVVRVGAFLWPRIAPRTRSAQVLRGLEVSRAERHANVELLAGYHRYHAASNEAVSLPDRTWNDLDLEDVLASLDFAESEPGRQYLYHLLRTPAESPERLIAFEAIVDRFSNDAQLAASARASLCRLRDRRSAYLVELFLGELPPRPRIWWIFPLLTLTSLACLAGVWFWPQAIVISVGVCVVNIAAQLSYKPRVKRFIPAIHELPAFLGVVDTLGNLDGDPFGEHGSQLRDAARRFSGLGRAARWLMLEPEQSSELAASLYEYVNLLFLFDVNAFVFTTESIHRARTRLQQAFETIGYLDAAQSVAHWRSTIGQWTQPDFSARAKTLDVDGVVHPLVADAVPNSLCLDERSALITGSNMSGKSTFVRALGVNAVLAQSVNTVCASAWRAPMLRVRTSIGRADSVMEGKSYYLAEAESVLELVRASDTDVQHLFLLDEIFRGTNTTERVAAAYAVLAHLDRGDDIVVVATHDLEVLDLLEDSFAAHHFREQIVGDELIFDYRLHDGRSSTRNAIALLRFIRYPDALVTRALNSLDWMERRSLDIS